MIVKVGKNGKNGKVKIKYVALSWFWNSPIFV